MNHQPGGTCLLRDQELGTDIRVNVPLDKKPGDVFKTTVERTSPPLESSLILLCSGNGPTALSRALKTLSSILTNLADASFTGNVAQIQKMSRMKLDNAMVYSNLISVPGAFEFLSAVGFQKVQTELVFTGLVDEAFIKARDAVNALISSGVQAAYEGEVKAGQEADLFGPTPSVGNLSWNDAREKFGSEGTDSGKKSSECRNREGVWTFGSGRGLAARVKKETDELVARLQREFNELAGPTDISGIQWDDEVLYNQRLMQMECAKCGAPQLWTGPIDGMAAEAHKQTCDKCQAELRPESCGARKILHFTGQVCQKSGGEFGEASKCPLCGRWFMSTLGCTCR